MYIPFFQPWLATFSLFFFLALNHVLNEFWDQYIVSFVNLWFIWIMFLASQFVGPGAFQVWSVLGCANMRSLWFWSAASIGLPEFHSVNYVVNKFCLHTIGKKMVVTPGLNLVWRDTAKLKSLLLSLSCSLVRKPFIVHSLGCCKQSLCATDMQGKHNLNCW